MFPFYIFNIAYLCLFSSINPARWLSILLIFFKNKFLFVDHLYRILLCYSFLLVITYFLLFALFDLLSFF